MATTTAELAAFAGTVVLHCFSEPGLLPALERGYYVSFAGNVTYPKAAELREAATQVPGRPNPRGDGQPVSGAATTARAAEQAGQRRPHVRVLAEARGEDPDELGARIDANATAAFGLAAA